MIGRTPPTLEMNGAELPGAIVAYFFNGAILYIFDFGDELHHLVQLEAIQPGGVETLKHYPRITEQQAKAPPQYLYVEEE